MEPQLHHTHGRHYDDHDAITASNLTGHDHNEDERHGEKKSVIKKVKEKAKKLKNTITKHGHGHGDHNHHEDNDEEEEDDDDDEIEKDPEVHGAPMYDSARVGLGGPDANLAQPRGNLETVPVTRYNAPPPVSTGAYGSNLDEPSGLGHPQGYGQDVNAEKWRGKIGQPTGMDEDPFAPNPTHGTMVIGIRHVSHEITGNRGQDVNQGGLRGIMGKPTGMVQDPDAPNEPRSGLDPSNYETKVTNPTHTGGKEAGLSHIEHSFDKMGIRDEHNSGSEPKTFDSNHPENLPRETLTGNPSSRSSTYVEKISSSASAIADKAAAAKDVIASRLGYSGEHATTTETHETVKNSGSTATDYAHKITEKVTGTLAPVYEKVVDAGSSVISKVQGTVSGAGQQQQVDRGDETVTVEREKETDKGVSVKEYLVETLRPGDEDKALSEKITHALHRGNQEESEKKSGEDKPMGIVTESVEVRERLGTDHRQQQGNNVSANKNVTERLSDAVGSWFGGKGDAPQGTLGTSYVTDEGLSSNPRGDQNK